jgi:cellulose synthase/poly-beta-1,6-N-acetylglucosamine synthase-like glycosyltransferase
LEYVPDLTDQFDILIIDDGSTDQTSELAFQFTRRYPQVHMIRHAFQQGYTHCVQEGLRLTTGDFVIVQDEHVPVSATHLRRLWQLRVDQRLVSACSSPRSDVDQKRVMQRLSKWAASLRRVDAADPSLPGTQLLCRKAVQQMGQVDDPEQLIRMHAVPDPRNKKQRDFAFRIDA